MNDKKKIIAKILVVVVILTMVGTMLLWSLQMIA